MAGGSRCLEVRYSFEAQPSEGCYVLHDFQNYRDTVLGEYTDIPTVLWRLASPLEIACRMHDLALVSSGRRETA
jgi:hypothetical protein